MVSILHEKELNVDMGEVGINDNYNFKEKRHKIIFEMKEK